MATDKRISELPIASGINNADACVLVSGGSDYQFAFSTLLQFLGTNLNTGANISFGSVLPQNITGRNGDVFVNTSTGAFAQRISGTWAVVYMLPTATGTADGSILYGTGTPTNTLGNNSDTYIDTGTGIFYKKTAGAWAQVFSIQSGPAGPRGNAVLNGTADPLNTTGSNGDFYLNTVTQTIFGPKTAGLWSAGTSLKGVNGNTVLNGTTDPLNNFGNNGDFYINTVSLSIFGPKSANVWPAGQNLAFSPPEAAVITITAGITNPVTVSNYQSSYAGYGNYPQVWFEELTDGGNFKIRTDIQPVLTRSAGILQVISFDMGIVPNGQIIIKS